MNKPWLVVKMSRLSSIITIAILSASLSEAVLANERPANMDYVGREAYKPVVMRRLRNARTAFVNLSMANELGYVTSNEGRITNNWERLLKDYGSAVLTKGETDDAYTKDTNVGYAAGIGGMGMNGNLGDGRSIVTGRFRKKGGGPTPMVSPIADLDHSSGASIMREAIREALIANLLAQELPYGAYQTLTLLDTGTQASHNSAEYQERAINIAEDPLRFGHFVLNPAAEQLGGEYKKFDEERIATGMSRIAEALPAPAGFNPTGKSQAEIFRIKLFEAIDRQAIQHAYGWAHRFFYGTISPSNAAIDGRMFDFGAVAFMDGYARVQLIADDGPNGSTEHFKRDLLKDIRDSWVKTLPPALLAALPSEKEWFDRFEHTYQKMRRTEMVRLAGSIDAIETKVLAGDAARNLGRLLVEMADAGNDQTIHTYKGETNYFGTGLYNMRQILNALAAVDLDNTDAMRTNLTQLIPPRNLRDQLITLYQEVFTRQRQIAAQVGIRSAAEARYRKEAAEIRNRPMDLMFWDSSENGINEARKNYSSGKDPMAIQNFITERIQASRRDFRDAAPFTLVLSEKVNAQTGQRTRHLFDARTNEYRIQRLALQENHCQNLLEGHPAFNRPSLKQD
jgi:hypothetical protein